MRTALPRNVLEARIEREREALADALRDLRDQARLELDLRRRVREHPSAWLAGALVIGLLVGLRR